MEQYETAVYGTRRMYLSRVGNPRLAEVCLEGGVLTMLIDGHREQFRLDDTTLSLVYGGKIRLSAVAAAMLAAYDCQQRSLLGPFSPVGAFSRYDIK